MKIPLPLVALAIVPSRTRAALPPGYEDVMWCPEGYCDRLIDRLIAGPARIFHECYDPAARSVVDEVWTGEKSDTVAPADWRADPPPCPDENDHETPPGFVTTPGCEDRCDGVEEGATGCDASAFEGCACVFGDPYCLSECDAGTWLTMCAAGDSGGVPPPRSESEEPLPPPPVSPPKFVTTPGCEDKCAGAEEGAKGCDDAAFEGCKCVFADPYCFSECIGGDWMMACAGGGGGDLPPPAKNEEAPPVPPPPLPQEDEATPATPPGFVTTPGCEDKCAGVEEGAKGCDAVAFEGCKCVFADPYCFTECIGGEWMTACAGGGGGDVPPLSSDDADPATNATNTTSPQDSVTNAPTQQPSRNADVGGGDDFSAACVSSSSGIAAGMTLAAVTLCFL